MPAAGYPPVVENLITALRQLPSVGPRGAERLALFLLEKPAALSEQLATAIGSVHSAVHPCPDCGFYAEGEGLCSICTDKARERSLWCVVEHAGDVVHMEKTGAFKGLYHVLGGRLSPLDNVGPEDLAIDSLRRRIERDKPTEIVLALSADVEGETTALYLAPLLKELGVKVTRLATGLPAGGGLDYADNLTLGYALSGRREVE